MIDLSSDEGMTDALREVASWYDPIEAQQSVGVRRFSVPPSEPAVLSSRRLGWFLAVLTVCLVGVVAQLQFKIFGDSRSAVTVNSTPATETAATASAVPGGPRFVTTTSPVPLQGTGDLGAAALDGSVVSWWGNDKGAADAAIFHLSNRQWTLVSSASGLAPRITPTVLPIDDRVVVWGGRSIDGPEEFNDGAILDMVTQEWSATAASPIGGRNNNAAIVWSGSELVVWGGRLDDARGAAYNPRANTWRQISEAPLAPRRGVATVWSGAEMLVWGGESFDRGTSQTVYQSDGAAYNPRTDTWRKLSPVLIAGRSTTGAWTGREFIVVGGTSSFRGGSLLHDTGAAYSPATDTWRQLPRGRAHRGNNVYLDGMIISWEGRLHPVYETASDSYIEVAHEDSNDPAPGKIFATTEGVAIVGKIPTDTQGRLWMARLDKSR